jgi:hypothetical protein
VKYYIKAIIVFALVTATVYVGTARNWSSELVMIALLCLYVLWLSIEVEKLKAASVQLVRDDHAKIVKQIEEGKAVEPNHHAPHKPLNSRAMTRTLCFVTSRASPMRSIST